MTITRILDKKRKTTTGENAGRFHIKIRVTVTVDKKTVQRCVMTNIYATEAEFKKIIGNPGKDKELEKKQSALNEIYERAKDIVRDNPFIDFESFKTELTSTGGYDDPLTALLSYAKKKRDAGKEGTAVYYELAQASWKEFAKEKCGGYLTFGSISPDLLRKYEKWMVERGRSITTVGMYTIAMRTVFSVQVKKNKIPSSLYPFGAGKYVIPTAKGRNLALTEEQKNKIISFRTLNPKTQKAADLFTFSYFSYGMNFKDMALLRFRDIKNDHIVFERAKTQDTTRERSFIEIPMRTETWDVIKRVGNYSKMNNPNAFVFDVLRDGLTPKQVKSRVHDLIAETNEALKKVAEELELPPLTTYWARHTFATIAWKKGADLIFIQRALGHSDPKTTQRYLDSFDIETKRMVANLL
jgi:integrase